MTGTFEKVEKTWFFIGKSGFSTEYDDKNGNDPSSLHKKEEK